MPNTDEKDGRKEQLPSWEPLTAAEVAVILRVPKRRVCQLGIPVVQLGPNTLRWMREDVEAFIRKRRIGRDAFDGRRP
jgi:hypothetical protein